MNFGGEPASLPQVTFSLGTATEELPSLVVESLILEEVDGALLVAGEFRVNRIPFGQSSHVFDAVRTGWRCSVPCFRLAVLFE